MRTLFILSALALSACDGAGEHTPGETPPAKSAPASAEPPAASSPAVPPTDDAVAQAPPGSAHQPPSAVDPALAAVKDPPEVALSGATELNNAGHRYYEAGNLDAAAKVWAAGVAAHPDHALLRYNLACALARLHAQRGACGAVEAYLADVFVHLEAAAEDPARRARMLVDDDLASLRHTYAFQRIAGGPLNAAATKAALIATPLFTVGTGAAGSVHKVTLSADGVATVQFTEGGLAMLCGGSLEQCRMKTPGPGSWSISDGTVTLNIDTWPTTYTLSPRGSLLPDDPFKALHPWQTECDA